MKIQVKCCLHARKITLDHIPVPLWQRKTGSFTRGAWSAALLRTPRVPSAVPGQMSHPALLTDGRLLPTCDSPRHLPVVQFFILLYSSLRIYITFGRHLGSPCPFKVLLFWMSTADCLLGLAKAVLVSPLLTCTMAGPWQLGQFTGMPTWSHTLTALWGSEGDPTWLCGNLLGSDQGWVCLPSPCGGFWVGRCWHMDWDLLLGD